MISFWKIVSSISYVMLKVVYCAFQTFLISDWSGKIILLKWCLPTSPVYFLYCCCLFFFLQMNHFLLLQYDNSLVYLPVYLLRPSVLFSFWILFKYIVYWGGLCITTAKTLRVWWTVGGLVKFISNKISSLISHSHVIHSGCSNHMEL